MKVLAVSNPGIGHVYPMLPLARALRAAGHELRFASAASFCPALQAVGFEAHAAGLDWLEPEIARSFPEFDTLPADQRGAFLLQDVFADMAAHAMVPDLLRLIADWRPDLLLRNDYEFGSCVAAEKTGLPHATVSICFFMSEAVLGAAVGDRLAYLRSAFGLPPYPATAMLYPHLVLSCAPASIEPRVLPQMHGLRGPDSATLPAAQLEQVARLRERLPDLALVYVSLGTVFNRNLPVFRSILEGLRDEPVSLVLSVGSNQDPAALGAQPPHVVVERWIAQDALLPHCSLFVTHSPLYTAMSALRHGVPLLMVPQGGDQPAHALRLARHGVGIVLRSAEQPDAALRAQCAELTPASVRAALHAIVGPASYRRRAAELSFELQALPDSGHAVRLLETLVRTGSAHSA